MKTGWPYEDRLPQEVLDDAINGQLEMQVLRDTANVGDGHSTRDAQRNAVHKVQKAQR